MTGDQVNGLFEFCGALAVLTSVRSIIKDKCYAGVSPYNLAFFQLWGLFNLYYYPSLHQSWSFVGGIFLALANAAYLFCLWKFPHRTS
jgi:hypothetical protein